MMKNRVWITWEDHRRSRELAAAFGCEYFCITSSKFMLIRYFILCLKTLLFVAQKKPGIIFCQNPSVVLAAFLCFIKIIFRFILIVDRHSNFKLKTVSSKNIKWIFFHLISDYSLKRACLTIVTNKYLEDFVISKGGRACVLPDKLPDLKGITSNYCGDEKKVTFICTYSSDEPVVEVIKAASILGQDYKFHVTGSHKKYKGIEYLKKIMPGNVTLTGFLPEDQYQELIASSDLLIIITTNEYTLTCGAYEAVSLGKPMILGNTMTIKEYFYQGAIYTDADSMSIAKGIEDIFNNMELYTGEVRLLKKDLIWDWSMRFAKVEKIVANRSLCSN